MSSNDTNAPDMELKTAKTCHKIAMLHRSFLWKIYKSHDDATSYYNEPFPNLSFTGWINLSLETVMRAGGGILLWLLGVPLPIILLIALFTR